MPRYSSIIYRLSCTILGSAILSASFASGAQAQSAIDDYSFDLESESQSEETAKQLADEGMQSDTGGEATNELLRADPAQTLTNSLIVSTKIRTGTDAVTNHAHVIAGALTRESTWNNEFLLSLQPFRGDAELLTIRAAAGSLRRPFLYGRSQRNGVGEPDRWQQLESWATTVTINPDALGLKYTGGVARTRYRSSTATRFQPIGSPLLGEEPWEVGASHWQRLELSRAIGSNSQLEISGFLASRSNRFHDTAIAIEHTPILAGQTREFRARWKHDDFEADIHGWRTDGDEIDARERTFTLRLRGIAAKWSKSSWGFNFEWPEGSEDTFNSNENSSELSLQVLPKKLIGDTAKPTWLPDRFLLVHGRAHINEYFDPSMPTDLKTEWQEVILAWDGSVSRTELGLSRRIRRHYATPHGVSSPNAALGVSVNQTFLGQYWDASVYANHDRTRSDGGGVSNWTAGFNWSLNQAALPKVTFGVDWNNYHDFSVLNQFSDEGLDLSLSVDFSRFLERHGMGNGHSLVLRGFTNYNVTRVQDLGKFRRVGPTAMISYNSRF